MAELADAHGSGPCENNFMQVQVLLPAPPENLEKAHKQAIFRGLFFLIFLYAICALLSIFKPV